VSLKLDKIIDWTWKEALWIFWVFCSMLIGLIFGLFLMTVSKICQTLTREVRVFEFFGLFWVFCVVAGYALTTIVSVFKITDL
jgi:uncharacterized membrane protein